MLSRRRLLQAGAGLVVLGARAARAANAPGVTDTEIKFGQSIPYSGPASAYAVLGRAEAAYFKMINDMGGVNGRKLNFLSVDDAYSPPKTVEQTRRLVEEEHVAFLFGNVGTPSNLAIRAYLNDNKVPQLFPAVGASVFNDPQHFPWTMPVLPNYSNEGRIYARQILATKPDAKIGILFQNDGFGKDYVTGFKAELGPEHAGMIVKEVSYELSDPTVNSQISTLQASGADTVLLAALAKAASQAIRKIGELDWTPTRYLVGVSASIPGTLKPAGLDRSKGVISATIFKDPKDSTWKDDPALKDYDDFVAKYLTPELRNELVVVSGYAYAAILVQVLKQCGDDLSRDNIMRQAANLKNFAAPMMLPGVVADTSPDNYVPIRRAGSSASTAKSGRFLGIFWEGDPLSTRPLPQLLQPPMRLPPHIGRRRAAKGRAAFDGILHAEHAEHLSRDARLDALQILELQPRARRRAPRRAPRCGPSRDAPRGTAC